MCYKELLQLEHSIVDSLGGYVVMNCGIDC